MRNGQRVAALGMAISGTLAIIKIVAGLLGHSTSVVADGFESAGDVVASGLVLFGLKVAAKPADSNHPYGHGRAEILTGLVLGLLLMAAGVGIAVHSLQRVGEVHPPPAPFVVWPLIGSAVVKTALSAVKFHFGRRLRSASLIADAWNDTVDILSAFAALVAVSLTLYDPERFLSADHYGGFAVGVIVVFTGLRVVRDTALQLMDTMPEEALMDKIRNVAIRVPGVLGVEKAYARKTGTQYHVDLHLEVNPEISVRESHEIGHAARLEILDQLEWVADVLVHIEPYLAPHRTSGM
jgi:cation diffusion facilitator family transporter